MSSSCDLSNAHCKPCRGSVPPLEGHALKSLVSQLNPDWHVVDEHHLERDFTFADFRQALDFTRTIGELSETEGHHPEMTLSWGHVIIRLWTHKVNGLTESDFILAAKSDRIYAGADLD